MAHDRVQLLSTAGPMDADQTADQAADWVAFARWLPALRLMPAVADGALRAWLPAGAVETVAADLPASTRITPLDGLLQADGASAD